MFTARYVLHSAFCLRSVCVLWGEQTAIISLYSINWLVFVTETEFVYCAVRTGYLNLTQVNVGLYSISRALVLALWRAIRIHNLLEFSYLLCKALTVSRVPLIGCVRRLLASHSLERRFSSNVCERTWDNAVVIRERLGSCEMDFVMMQDLIAVTQCDVCDKTFCTASTVWRAFLLLYSALTFTGCVCIVFNIYNDATWYR